MLFRPHKLFVARRHAARGGFTMLELVLVLALLVLLVAMIWPALDKPLDSQQLINAAQQLRAQWTRARVEAMTSGITQVFHYQQEAGTYRIEPWQGLEIELEATRPLGVDSTADTPAPMLSDESTVTAGGHELPEGVVFFAAQSIADSRAAGYMATGDVANVGSISSEPIFFYPDGTTSTARLVIGNEQGLYMLLELRGLTGIVTLSDPLSIGELPQ